jgi:hypothetical protein
VFGQSVCHDFPDRLIRQPRGCALLATFLAIVLLLGLQDSLCAQQHPDSIAVVLGPEFEKEWPYGMLFGDHHQSLWTTPVTIELLRLSSNSGALKPCREIVTPDNRLLLLATPSGDTVVFTPLRERFAEDDVDPRDRRLIPTHPSSALVADELSRAAGLMTSQPRMVWLPDDPLLGRFRDTYGGSAGFLASTGPGRMSASVPFLDSRELFRTLDADSRNGVDTRAFILSRFIDLLTGDWQRSIWKWWWFAAPENGRILFSPMPAMRRQSLLMLSSFPATIHGALTPGFLNFTSELSDVSRAVATGAALDVRVLSGMDRNTWEGLAREFTASMSDSAIDAAILKFPPPHRQAEGDTIARLLKIRRDSLASVSIRYYLTIAEYAEVRLSDAAENVTVDRLEDGRVNVTAWQRAHASTPVYSRVFLPDETKEIRLHCLGGNDSVIVRGSAGRTIVVRVDGGAGDDVLKDESRVWDAETGFLTWFSGSTAMTFLYDYEGTNDLAGGEGTIIDTSPESEFVPPGRFF